VAAIGLMGVALVAILWTTQRSVRNARAIMLKGQASEANGLMRARMMEMGDAPLEQRLKAAFEAAAAQHLTYVAALERDDSIVAEAGTSSLDRAAMVAWIASAKPGVLVQVGERVRVVYKRTPRPPRANEPPAPPRDPAKGPAGFVFELDPVVVDDLDSAATLSLMIGFAAALTLLVLTAILVRWSLRREDTVRAVEQARHLASLGQMSAVLAHEIRNPLASLKGNAQLLARSLPEGDRPRAKADRVVDEAVRLEHLTNDLLAFARSGEITVADADPGALLRDAAAAVDGERIRVDDAAAPRSWPLDADRMRQVLVNLLENAAEMSDGPIDAAVSRDGGGLRFTVRDHGPGLPPADLERLFEPFFTKRIRGTGLGLAVCKRLVDLHGGTIVAGNAGGGGAEFRIDLPKGGA
jgi:two-component system sensor histidine kinase HydH